MSESNGSDFTTDTSTDKATDDSQAPASAAFSTQAASSGSSDDSTDDLGDVASGNSDTQNYSMLAETDPTTGVQTSLLLGDIGHEVASDTASDDANDDQTNGSGANSDVQSERANLETTDNSDDHGPVDIFVSGSPASGVTVDFTALLSSDDAGSGSAASEETSQASGSDTGDVKFEKAADMTISGTVAEDIIARTNWNDGAGNSGSATDTTHESGALGAASDDADLGDDNFADVTGQPSTDQESDTNRENAVDQATDHTTDDVQAKISAMDVASGLQSTFVITDHATDGVSFHEDDTSVDAHSAQGADVVTSDEDAGEDDQRADHSTLTGTTQGTDARGEEVSMQEQITLDDSETDDVTDDNSDTPTGSGTSQDVQTLVVHDAGTTVVSDNISTSVSTVDATTGIKTTTTVTDTKTGNGNDTADETETDIATSSGSNTDTAAETAAGSGTVTWNTAQTVTQTNPDGSSAGNSSSATDSGSQTLNWQDSFARDATGQLSQTVNAPETGYENSSDPSVGDSSWSNRPLDATASSQAFGTPTFAATLTPSGASDQDSGPAPTEPSDTGDSNGVEAVADMGQNGAAQPSALVIDGTPLSKDSAAYKKLATDELRAQVLDAMIAARNKIEVSAAALEVEVAYRANVIKAAQQLAALAEKKKLVFPNEGEAVASLVNAPAEMKAAFKTYTLEQVEKRELNLPHGILIFRPTPDIPTPADAVERLFDGKQTLRCECLTAQRLAVLKGMLETFGKKAFNKFAARAMVNAPKNRFMIGGFEPGLPAKALSVTNKFDLLPGDMVIFSNPGATSETWRNENAIYLGGGKFFAHGFGIVTQDELVKKLAGRAAADSDPATLESVVFPSLDYLGIGVPDDLFKRYYDIFKQGQTGN